MGNWYNLAKYCERTYITFVDFDEEFFICPECEEPIYSDDWEPSDFTLGERFRGKMYYPICENILMGDED